MTADDGGQHDHADIVRINPELAALLMDNSPRLTVLRPTLVRHGDSPTGWIVVIPGPPSLFADEGPPGDR